jgi:L,D-transpeptidase YcbB
MFKSFGFFIPFLCLFIVLHTTLPAKSISYDSHNYTQYLKQQLDQSENGELSIDKNNITMVKIISDFYQQNSYQLAWKEQTMIQRLLKAIDDSAQLGLSPNDYHAQAIKQNQTTQMDDSIKQRVQADILMTDAFLRLVYHMRFGKVIANEMEQHGNLMREFLNNDPVTKIKQVLSSEQNLHQFFNQLTDLGVLYKALIKALAYYQKIEQEGGWQQIPEGKMIKPEMQDQRLSLIKARLHSNGFLTSNDGCLIYDESAVDAVKQFQSHYNLKVDGIIGKNTLEQMNMSITQRIEQIKANLERVRWIRHNMTNEFVLVNIAGYKIYYVRNNQLLWQSKVQVGKNYRKTPILRDEIEYIVLNPTWTIPPTILEKDILPKIKQDPTYLQKKNMNVIDLKGNVIDDSTIDWSSMTAKKFPHMIRQKAGPNNALGRVKIMFPNKHLVYLHDTPNKSLFNKTDRAFSSGCIRVEKPFELVELLLKNNSQWSQSRLKTALMSGYLRHINLPENVPVLLLYFTAVLGENGQIKFFKDIYNWDKKIIEGLKQPFQLMISDKS